MAVSARKIVLDNEGEELAVHLWVSRDGSLEISFESDSGRDRFDVVVAVEIARAASSLAEWAVSPAGQKRLAELQEKEQRTDNHRPSMRLRTVRR